jgi:hypothetical protein
MIVIVLVAVAVLVMLASHGIDAWMKERKSRGRL